MVLWASRGWAEVGEVTPAEVTSRHTLEAFLRTRRIPESTGSTPGLERSHGERKGYPLQSSCLEEFHGQRSLMSYSSWGHKVSDTTEQLTFTKPIMVGVHISLILLFLPYLSNACPLLQYSVFFFKDPYDNIEPTQII